MTQITESKPSAHKAKQKIRENLKKTKLKKITNMSTAERNELIQHLAEELGFEFKDTL